MRILNYLFGTLALMGFFVTPASAQSSSCPQTELVSFKCEVGVCKQTISVRRCKQLTTGSSLWCDACMSTRVCCGSDVCSAGYIGTCSGPNPNDLDALLTETRSLPFKQAARIYIANCAGGYIPLRTVRTRTMTAKQEAD